MPGLLHSKGFSLKEIGLVLYISPNGFFGTALKVAASVIIMFMLFSHVLGAIGGTNWFIKLALCFVGPRGAVQPKPPSWGVPSSARSPAALKQRCSNRHGHHPPDEEQGYSPEYAGGVEAVASVGGQILPPVMGAVAFIIAETIEKRYIDVCSAAVVPALFYFAALFYGVDIESRKKNLPGLTRQEITPFATVMKEGWFYLIPLGILIYFLVFANIHPRSLRYTRCSLWSC